MVEVILAGYQIDAEVIKICKEAVGIANTDDSIHGTEAVIKLLNQLRPDMFTPEVISAAYARISRDPRDIPALRAETRANVEAAKRSNRQILFGQGHKAVADGISINYDVLGISRLAVEGVEKTRIGMGAVEKSQRYIELEGKQYVIPSEYLEEDKLLFVDLVENEQFRGYKESLPILLEYHKSMNPKLVAEAEALSKAGKSDKMNGPKNTLEGYAKEDARYNVGLSMIAQIGLTYNTRAVEHRLRVLRYSDLAEERLLSDIFLNQTKEIAPSMIALSSPELFKQEFGKELVEDNYRETSKNLKAVVKKTFAKEWNHRVKTPTFKKDGFVKLIEETDVDTNVIAALLFANSNEAIEDCYGLAAKLKRNRNNIGNEFIKESLKYVSEFDAVPREFEINGGFIYHATISSSCFAQLKRHRMMTLLAQPYDPSLGYREIPKSIVETGLTGKLIEVCERSAELAKQFAPKYGRASEYCYTNATMRNALIASNQRQNYAVSRQREDSHAQWAIRYLENSVVRLTKKKAPLTSILMCGKDKFKELREEVYKK